MKKIILILGLLLIIVLILSYIPMAALAKNQDNNLEDLENELQENIDNQLDNIDWDILENFIEENGKDNSLIGDTLLDTLKNILSGNFQVDSGSFLEYIFQLILAGVKKLLPVFSGVAVISILSGLVSKTKTNLLNESTGNLINYFLFSMVLLLLMNSVFDLVINSKNVVLAIKKLSNITTPILLTLMTATGAKVSTKVYSPTITLLSEGVIDVVANIVLPAFIFCFVFSIISNLSKEIRLKELTNFFKNLSSWILGITFTVFTGFLAIQGLTAATIDGVSIRAAKFATKTYIPILGGYLADGFDLILTSCVLIKNSFGVIVLLMLVSIILSPLLKIIIFNFGLNFISAIIEPIADNTIIGFLIDLRKIISILLVSVLAVTFMLFILVMMIIFSANIY